VPDRECPIDEPKTTVERIIDLLCIGPSAGWTLSTGAANRAGAILREATADDAEDLLKLLHVLETRHGAHEAADALRSVIVGVPRLSRIIADRCSPAAELVRSARALAAFEDRRSTREVAHAPAAVVIPVFRLRESAPAALEARRVPRERTQTITNDTRRKRT
jgi:hypothetical protein